jgi:PHD/YefM family antitoxin component YafN of YafNO toxin-antitoxin module
MTAVRPIDIQSTDGVRKNLRRILDNASAHRTIVIVKRYRQPMAVILSYEDYLTVEPHLTPQPAAR